MVRTISTPIHKQPTKETPNEHNVAYVRCRQKKSIQILWTRMFGEQKMAGPARCTQQVKQTDVKKNGAANTAVAGGSDVE